MDTTTYGIVHYFPGGTKEQYEATFAAVGPGDGRLPAGTIFHAAGPSTGGWRIMALFESKEIWEEFRDNTLLPLFHQGIPGGFTSPPEETAIEVYKLMP